MYRAIYSFWRPLLSILVKLVTFSSNAHTKLVAYQLLESVLIRHLNLTLSYIMSMIWPVLFSLSLMISIYSFWWKLISLFLLACWCDSFAIALMQIHFPDQKLKILFVVNCIIENHLKTNYMVIQRIENLACRRNFTIPLSIP